MSSATAVSADSGIITSFPGEIGLLRKNMEKNGLYSMAVCIMDVLVEYEVMLGLGS